MGHWAPTGVEPKDYDDDDDEYPERNEVGLSQGIKIIKTKTTKTRNVMTTEQRSYIFMCKTEGAQWSSGIDAATGARGRGSRPVYYLTLQRPWTSRYPLIVCNLDKRLSGWQRVI